MKTRTPSLPRILTAAAAAGLFFAGCVNDPSPSSGNPGELNATVEGRVQGDMGLGKRAGSSGSAGSVGIEGATVTVLRIQPDGSLQAVSSAEVKTDAQGRFSVQAAVDGVRELVVKAKKDGKEWKAVVSGKAKAGAAIVCRPLDTESSLEADVLAKVRGGSHSMDVSFADIASHIDAATASEAGGKAEVTAYLSAQFETEAEARLSVLTTGAGKFTLAQIAKANEARMDAEAGLESGLDASVDASAEAKAKLEADFRAGMAKAWTDAGITAGEAAKAEDSCYHAMIRAGADAAVDAEAKLAWLRKLAFDLAVSLQASADEDVKASGGSDAAVLAAGAALQVSVNMARTQEGIDSAFTAFHAAVTAMLGHGFSLTGKAEGDLSGAAVQVAKVKADGSLEILSDIGTKTDAQGSFTLNTAAKLPDSVVLVVTKDDAKLMVMLDSAVSKPVQVGTETTVEAKLFQQLLKDGQTGLLSSGDIRAHVDSAVAADVHGNDSAIAHVMGGLEIAAKAQGAFLIGKGFGANATVQSGVDAATYAASLEVYAHALAYCALDIAAETRFSLIKDAHAKAALSLSAAAEAQAKIAGAGEVSLKALAQAGLALQASVKAAVSAEAIASAYESYHASVTASLKTALALQAAALESVDAKIHGQDGARAELMGKIKGAADAEALAKAQMEFSIAVEAQVKAALGSGLGAPSAVQAEAAAQALVLANMGG